MLAEAEHVELAEALHAVNAAVLLSGYADWPKTTMRSRTGGRSTRTEVVWSNRPFPGTLFSQEAQ